MASTLFERLAEEVKNLTPEEQVQLRVILERILMEELQRRLLAKGIISHIPPPLTEADIARHAAYKPITIQGKPLSETIIEERR